MQTRRMASIRKPSCRKASIIRPVTPIATAFGLMMVKVLSSMANCIIRKHDGRYAPAATNRAKTVPQPTAAPTVCVQTTAGTRRTSGKEDGHTCPPAGIPADVRGRPATLPPPAGRPYKRPTCREQPGNRPAARCRTPCADGWRDARIRGFAHAGHVSA